MRFSNPVTQAVILAGGRGTRLGAITRDVPKPLLPVAGTPFLEYLLWNLARQGVVDVVLSVGYLADTIESALGDGSSLGVRIRYAAEPQALGTGGGVRNAGRLLDRSRPWYVLNGDTIFDAPLAKLPALLSRCPSALAGLLLRRVPDAGRYGVVELHEGLVESFREKGGEAEGLINGGIYLLTPEALALLPEEPCSLERDFFPPLASRKMLAGCESEGFFLDIGLPETLALAQEILPQWRREAGRCDSAKRFDEERDGKTGREWI